MNTDEKINYMIGCLQVVKDEMDHMAECVRLMPVDYNDDEQRGKYRSHIKKSGMPNKSLATDNLRNVARMAFKLAREIEHGR